MLKRLIRSNRNKSLDDCIYNGRCDTGDIPKLDKFIDETGQETCETEIGGPQNAAIVFGRDRPGGVSSGYGGRGHTHCASIDIVAGRMGDKAQTVTKDQRQIYVDPNFTTDAARIYISQKTDVDANFGLPKGSLPYSTGRSAIALKADSIRVIARQGVKIVAGNSRVNSQGGSISPRAYGIDLIANNGEGGLQPIPKGENLVQAFSELTDNLEELCGIVFSFVTMQMIWNGFVQTHTHVSPFFAIPVPPSNVLNLVGGTVSTALNIKVKQPILLTRANYAGFRSRNLMPHGPNYINSFYNKTS